jgi:uncharacterized protein YaiI (UPF0178 family)
MLLLYVDADACPVKDETQKVADRYGWHVYYVSNTWMQTPESERAELVRVSGDFDAADDWIAERAGAGDLVITTDIPLAARCLANGARVLGPKGKEFNEDSIGSALAKRQMLAQLRESGAVTGGPAPFENKDRSAYLQALDRLIHAQRRAHGAP